MTTKIFTCDCNASAPMDRGLVAKALSQAGLASELVPASQLCRRQTLEFAAACEGSDDIVVNCTQERALFEEIAAAKKVIAPVRFVNTREFASWSAEASQAGPKIAALLAMAQAEPMEPVASVSYRSQGRLAVLGNAQQVMLWGDRLAGQLQVTGFVSQASASKADALESPAGGLVGATRPWVMVSASQLELTGWLGEFSVQWSSLAPIDLESCVRCGACVTACPEAAISPWLQIDMELCTGHRACVTACGSIAAIDFSRPASVQSEVFDLVLDLREAPAFAQHQPPQGYFWGPQFADSAALALKLVTLVGEFEKPRFFKYKESLCAHSRNEKTGCNQCIDVCSAKAIEGAGNGIQVNPHLCVGCGACTTVCPSGALTYAYPTVPTLTAKLRQGLRAYHAAGGKHGVVLLHDEETALSLLHSLSGARPRSGPAAADRAPVGGLPAHVIPVGLRHAASSGLDVWLAALAFGAGQVAILLDGSQAPQYRAALNEQAAVGNAIVSGLGLPDNAIRIIDASTVPALRSALGISAVREARRVGIAQAARFQLSNEKRRSIESAIDHLAQQAAYQARAPIALPKASPFGTLSVDTNACTMCLACVGACPQSALSDNQESPQLRFLERNCVQCGLCETTCPENAISLIPQLDLSASARELRVINEAKPFHCIRCSKPFGTAVMVENMMAKLLGHSLFPGKAIERLKMCADCRVVDMMSNQQEKSIFDFTDAPDSMAGKPGRGES